MAVMMHMAEVVTVGKETALIGVRLMCYNANITFGRTYT